MLPYFHRLKVDKHGYKDRDSSLRQLLTTFPLSSVWVFLCAVLFRTPFRLLYPDLINSSSKVQIRPRLCYVPAAHSPDHSDLSIKDRSPGIYCPAILDGESGVRRKAGRELIMEYAATLGDICCLAKKGV